MHLLPAPTTLELTSDKEYRIQNFSAFEWYIHSKKLNSNMIWKFYIMGLQRVQNDCSDNVTNKIGDPYITAGIFKPIADKLQAGFYASSEHNGSRNMVAQ